MRLNPDAFRCRLRAAHGDAISLAGEYRGGKRKANFFCDAGHSFEALPGNLVGSKPGGCKRCSFARYGERQRLSLEEVIARIAEKHGTRIRLAGDFVTTKRKTLFSCDMGHEWLGTPHGILIGSGGCQACATKNNSLHLRRAESGIRDEIRAKHEGRVELAGEYVSRSALARFRCDKGHQWMTSPHNVIIGRGCRSCSRSGFNPSKPAILYYVQITGCGGERLYKVGITNVSVVKRFIHEKNFVRVVREWLYDDGAEAATAENTILNMNKQYRYSGPKVFTRGGDTELFTKDVLLLD